MQRALRERVAVHDLASVGVHEDHVPHGPAVRHLDLIRELRCARDSAHEAGLVDDELRCRTEVCSVDALGALRRIGHDGGDRAVARPA